MRYHVTISGLRYNNLIRVVHLQTFHGNQYLILILSNQLYIMLKIRNHHINNGLYRTLIGYLL